MLDGAHAWSIFTGKLNCRNITLKRLTCVCTYVKPLKYILYISIIFISFYFPMSLSVKTQRIKLFCNIVRYILLMMQMTFCWGASRVWIITRNRNNVKMSKISGGTALQCKIICQWFCWLFKHIIIHMSSLALIVFMTTFLLCIGDFLIGTVLFVLHYKFCWQFLFTWIIILFDGIVLTISNHNY